ncbi:hypothetical protein D3C84_1212700 [compost metagenome]
MYLVRRIAFKVKLERLPLALFDIRMIAVRIVRHHGPGAYRKPYSFIHKLNIVFFFDCNLKSDNVPIKACQRGYVIGQHRDTFQLNQNV